MTQQTVPFAKNIILRNVEDEMNQSSRVRQLISQLIDIANSDFKTLHYNSVSC